MEESRSEDNTSEKKSQTTIKYRVISIKKQRRARRAWGLAGAGQYKSPYTLQEDKELKEYTPAIRIKAGELVCDAEYFNKVAGARGWWLPRTRPVGESVSWLGRCGHT